LEYIFALKSCRAHIGELESDFIKGENSIFPTAIPVHIGERRSKIADRRPKTEDGEDRCAPDRKPKIKKWGGGTLRVPTEDRLLASLTTGTAAPLTASSDY